jgi:hypothetical protein
MAELHSGDSCPQCKEGEVHRVSRRDWMRRLHSSKHYKCNECRARFLTVRKWTIRLPKAKEGFRDED